MCLNLILCKKYDLMVWLLENSMWFLWESLVNLFIIFVCFKFELYFWRDDFKMWYVEGLWEKIVSGIKE